MRLFIFKNGKIFFNLQEKFYRYDFYYNLPKNQAEMNSQAFNPVIIHQWNGKWYRGRGLTIYRRIVQY